MLSFPSCFNALQDFNKEKCQKLYPLWQTQNVGTVDDMNKGDIAASQSCSCACLYNSIEALCSRVYKMPEDWKRPEASRVKQRVIIWLTEAPFSCTVLINVTKQHNEDSSCFPYISERQWRRVEGHMNKQNQVKVPGLGQCNTLSVLYTSPRGDSNSNGDMKWLI